MRLTNVPKIRFLFMLTGSCFYVPFGFSFRRLNKETRRMADDIDNLLSMLDRAIQESHDPKQIRAYENAKDILNGTE